MLYINTIQDYLNLPAVQQVEINKAINTRGRLENWLREQNKIQAPTGPEVVQGSWVRCKKCMEHPGWVWHKDRDNRDLHPSGITKCIKALWYGYLGVPAEKNIEPRLQMIFDIGHAWHDVIQGYGKKGAWVPPENYHKEVEIDPDQKNQDGTPTLYLANKHRIRGNVDAILTNYTLLAVPGVGDVCLRIVHEYKTIGSEQYKKLTKPKWEHKWQATIYAAVFDVPLVVYVYTNKDNCQIMDFPLSFDSTIWADIVQKIDRVLYYVNTQQMPPWSDTVASQPTGRYECEECPFKKVCQPPV